MSSFVSLGITDFMFIGGMLHTIAEEQEQEQEQEQNAHLRLRNNSLQRFLRSISSHHGSCHAWLLFYLHETLVSLISLLSSITRFD